MMKRNGHSVFEITRQVIRNFFNEDDERTTREFQQLIREAGLLNNASELESKEQLITWLAEPSRFSSKDAYRKFYQHVRQKQKVRMLRNFRVAASFLLILALGGVAYWLNDFWDTGNGPKLMEEIHPIMSKAYIMMDDGTCMVLGKDEGEVLEADGTKIVRDSTKVKYTSENDKETSKIAYNELNVPRGGEYVLELSDGTKVWVNADSRLKYPIRFREECREVYLLTGEAYFEVARNEAKPFWVHTSRGSVKVLGTEFNVRDYPDEHQVVATLVNGSVQFSDKNKSGRQVILQPGFQVVVDSLRRDWEVRKVNLEEYVGWRNGLYVFSHLTLEELMKIVERNYDVTVFFANEECKKLIFSGDLQKYEKVEYFLRFMETGGDVRFVVKDRTITVYKK